MVRYIIHCAVIPVVVLGVLTGCATSTPRPGTAVPAATTPCSQCTKLAPYLEVLADSSTGQPAQQQARVDAALTDSRAVPTATNQLRYALALGHAGRTGSDPLEALRLITALLAVPDALEADEKILAQSFAREFESRIDLSSALARQRDQWEARLDAEVAHAVQRHEALAAENARLKRALADSNRKLKAVAEIEQQLLDQGSDPEPAPPPP